MPVMIPACFCPQRRFAGRALLWPLVSLLLLLTLLLAPYGATANAGQAADDLVANPLETVIAVGRESGHWRHSRSAERIRLPDSFASDINSDVDYLLPAQQPLRLAGSNAIARVQPASAAVVSRFTRPEQARAPPLSLLH